MFDVFKVQQCNNTNQGTQLLYNNRMGNDQTLICVKENDVYQWKFLDGKNNVNFPVAILCWILLGNILTVPL